MFYTCQIRNVLKQRRLSVGILSSRPLSTILLHVALVTTSYGPNGALLTSQARVRTGHDAPTDQRGIKDCTGMYSHAHGLKLPVRAITLCLPQRAATMSERQLSLPFVKSTNVTRKGCAADINSQSPVKPFPLEVGILGQNDDTLTLPSVERARRTESTDYLATRVMARLQQAEAHEVNLHLKSDYRQAWITVSFLQKDVPNAFAQASYRMYGLHPDNVWPSIVADRKARLGAEYHDFYDSADNLRPDVPKIPPTTADADTHAANGASHDDWDIAGLVPTQKGIV